MISGSTGHPLNVVLAARAMGGDSGQVQFSGGGIRTYGGDITIGGGDVNASGYAVNAGATAGVKINNAILDATGDASGVANATLPTATSGGNITIRGKGNSIAGSYNWGVQTQSNVGIVTGGSGAISIEGHGGNGPQQWAVGSVGVLFESGSYVKANTGSITVKGYKGTGADAYGIASTESSKLIGTNGQLLFEGDSLMIRNATLTISAGQDSDIKMPIVGCTGASGCAAYTFVKQGAGILNLWGNAESWNSSRPSNTVATPINGTFTDAENKVNVVAITANQALYAFGTRPTTVTEMTTSSAAAIPGTSVTVLTAYLRLIGGSSYYGDTPNLTWALYDASSGGNAIDDASPSGSLTWSTILTDTSAVNTYSLSYVSGIALSNIAYTLSPGTAVNWVINPRPLNVNVNKTYDSNANFSSGFSLGNVPTGFTAPTVNGSAAVSSPNAAAYNSFASSTLTLSDNNYTLSGGTVSATITSRPVTVTADAKSKTEGTADSALTYQAETQSGNRGLVTGETLSGALTRVAGEAPATYAIQQGTVTNGNNANYDIQYVGANLTITAAPEPESPPPASPPPAPQPSAPAPVPEPPPPAPAPVPELPLPAPEPQPQPQPQQEPIPEPPLIPSSPSSTTTSGTTTAQNSAVSTIQHTVVQPVVNTSTTPNIVSPSAPPPTVVMSQQGTLPILDVNGGLALVQLDTPQNQSGTRTTTNIQSVADLPPDVSGRDPLGFMRVFVVGGGLSLPEVALNAPAQNSQNDATPNR